MWVGGMGHLWGKEKGVVVVRMCLLKSDLGSSRFFSIIVINSMSLHLHVVFRVVIRATIVCLFY